MSFLAHKSYNNIKSDQGQSRTESRKNSKTLSFGGSGGGAVFSLGSLRRNSCGSPRFLNYYGENSTMDEDSPNDLLSDVLHETDLSKFQQDLALKLQITKLEHFDHVKDSDLKNIGLSQPAIRRLQKAIKEKRSTLKKSKNQEKKLKKDSPLHHRIRNNSQGACSSELEPTCIIAREDVKLFEPLGEGSFGVVKRAIWNQGYGKKSDVAVKCLRNNDDFADDFMAEVDKMHRLKHPNLIRLYGLIISKPLMMVVELCSGGALLDRLRHTQKPVLLLTQLLRFGIQIVEGMTYLETKNFIHRDLASRNVLLATEEEDVVKIGDFGLMRALRNNEEHYVMTGRKKVPFAWCPPESLIKRQFSHASDVWSFGVTLWEMFSFGEEPWCGYSGPEVLQKVSSGERLIRPDACPLSVYQLIKQCWSHEPAQRPTFAALKDLLKESEIQRGDSKESQTGEGLLEIAPGDKIIVADGGSDSYYWFGQNVRTRKFGKFARKLLSLNVNVSTKDISHPIRGSFVHTGHGDGKGGSSWGHPDKIDDIYLRNPMPLLDLEEEPKKHQQPFETISIPKPPKSERHSSRGSAGAAGGATYYGTTSNASGGSPASSNFDPFEPGQSDALSFTSHVSSDESKESTKSSFGDSYPHDQQHLCRDQQRQQPQSPYNKTYYSVVPREEEEQEQTVASPPTLPTPDFAARYYDHVPQDPDPFEIPSQVKCLANSQRYSQMYSTVSKIRQPADKALSPSTGRVKLSTVDAMTEVPPAVPSMTSSPQRSAAKPDIRVVEPAPPNVANFNSNNALRHSFAGMMMSSSLARPCGDLSETPIYNVQNRGDVFTFESSRATPPQASRVVYPATNNVVSADDYARRMTSLNDELANRLNLHKTAAHPPPVWQFGGQPLGGYATAFADSSTAHHASNVVLRIDKSHAQQRQHHYQQQQQKSFAHANSAQSRTFSEPDVSRTGFLQPVVRSSLGNGLDDISPVATVASKQVLDLFDPLSDKPPGELIEDVHRDVPFASRDRCGQVLKRCNLDVQSAVQELKIQKLVDMGLGEREICRVALSKNKWDIELAASAILG